MGVKSYYFENNEIKPMDDILTEGTALARPDDTHVDLLKDVKVLVIDDNFINLTVAKKTLAKFGAETITALNGAEGIEAFKANDVQLILMDLHMPFMDGFETTLKLKTLPEFEERPTFIMAYTTYAYDDVKDQIEKNGLDGYIGKPFTQYQVLERIIEVIKPE